MFTNCYSPKTLDRAVYTTTDKRGICPLACNVHTQKLLMDDAHGVPTWTIHAPVMFCVTHFAYTLQGTLSAKPFPPPPLPTLPAESESVSVIPGGTHFNRWISITTSNAQGKGCDCARSPASINYSVQSKSIAHENAAELSKSG